jgi:hypothetical protein
MGNGHSVPLKTLLITAGCRVGQAKTKKANRATGKGREIAELMKNGKDESARIQTEAVLRDHSTVEGLGILRTYLQLLLDRLPQIEEAQQCPTDLVEAVSAVIWVANRIEKIPDLLKIRTLLTQKFGTRFAQQALNNAENVINADFYRLMTVMVPEPYVVTEYMQAVAREFEVK